MCDFGEYVQQKDKTVAVKCITKKNLAKSQNLLSKEIKILQVLFHDVTLCNVHHVN